MPRGVYVRKAKKGKKSSKHGRGTVAKKARKGKKRITNVTLKVTEPAVGVSLGFDFGKNGSRKHVKFLQDQLNYANDRVITLQDQVAARHADAETRRLEERVNLRERHNIVSMALRNQLQSLSNTYATLQDDQGCPDTLKKKLHHLVDELCPFKEFEWRHNAMKKVHEDERGG